MPKYDINKVALQENTHAKVRFQQSCKKVFSFKLAAYFQNTFPRNNSGGLLKSVDEFSLIIYVGGFFFLVNL